MLNGTEIDFKTIIIFYTTTTYVVYNRSNSIRFAIILYTALYSNL